MFKNACQAILTIALTGCFAPPPIGGGVDTDVPDCTDEICNGGDDDCNGLIDEGGVCDVPGSTACYGDGDFDGHFGGTPIIVTGLSCPTGLGPTPTDCDDANWAIKPGATEQCNGFDDNCNGQIDEGVANRTWYRDQDEDTFGNVFVTASGCSAPAGYVDNNTDCDDSSSQARPNRADEDCGDGVDNNCDGFEDEDDQLCPEGAMERWYFDGDADGYGDIETYQDSVTRPYPSNRWLRIDSDCDDTAYSVNPAADENCMNSVDDDCDGTVNDGCPTGPTCTPSGPEVCGNTVDEDCSGTANACPECVPTGVEVCGNTVDEDCSGVANACPEDPTPPGVVWYFDYDEDGYGGTQQVTQVASPGAKWTTQGGDCDDDSPWSNPSEVEWCDEEDNDCDGQIDENVAADYLPTWYRDADGDTFGNSAVTQRVCVRPQGYVSNRTDCDDTTSSRRPGAVELCNGIDDDCDGTATDEPSTCSTTPPPPPPTSPTLRNLTVCVDVCHGGTCGPWIPEVVSRAQLWVKNTTRGTGSWYAMNAITIDWNRAGNLEASACGQISVATGDVVILNGFVLNTNTNRWEHFVGPNDTDTTARFGRPYFPGGGDDHDFRVATHSYRNGTDGDAVGKAFVATVDAVDSN